MDGTRLQGRVAAITGGGRGLGRATALRFAREGAAVMVVDADAANAEAVAAEITATGSRASACRCDVTRRAEVEAMVAATVTAFGRLDILVTYAGVALFKPFLEVDDAEWDRQMAVNVTGTFLCAQVAGRLMVQQRHGRIITVSSVMGQRSGDRRSSYGMTKGAVIALTKHMAAELGPFGVTVNSIAPGPVQTELWLRANPNAAKTRDTYLQNIPMGRLGAPEDMANAAFLLASDDAAYITGHVLNVDGGFIATGVRDGVY
ncbi:MAG: glucose 1-dehydrogenase [Alphaproteobacteria bacterium]|nr:glucose 1-dehydrogenase [Alphaproteobacteria bacterium]